MDENSGPIQTLDPDEINAPEMQSSSGGGSLGNGLQNAAKNAKETLGSAKGGAGDGIGNAFKNGLGSVGGAGGSVSSPLSGLSGAGKSMDGMKGMGSNTPNMFKGLENNSNPAGKNDMTGDKQNPAAKDYAKKVGKNASQKVQQFADDAVKTAKDVQNISRAIGTGGADAAADAELLKEILTHPIETAKRWSRVTLYFSGFILLQCLVVFAILGALFFGVYKVFLVSREAATSLNPVRVANELRVNREMASFLISAVTQLAYERDVESQKKSGVAVAQSQQNIPRPETNPETSKMYEAWEDAGLASRFLDDYNASFVPTISSGENNTANPDNWSLVVNGQNFGPVNSNRAQAFIGIFAEDTTHWNDIYTREALQSVASNEFNTESFILDLPDSENNIVNSRENTTRQLVSTTAQPLSEKSGDYYSCLISGESACDGLGLGSSGSPNNDPSPESTGFLGSLFNNIRDARVAAKNRLLENSVGQDNLGSYITSTVDQVTPETSAYTARESLSANIRTGASDTILNSISKDEDGTPSADVLLDLYDRFQTSTNNGNFARVNYDRESRQSVALAENYFIAGGQLLNNEIGLLDSWALSENLSVVAESPVFRASVIGNPIGLFAETNNDGGSRQCQQIYNDSDPVGDASQNINRPISKNSCFTRSLIPDASRLQEDRSINRIYGMLEQKNREADADANQNTGLLKQVGSIIPKLGQDYSEGRIRTSPVATDKIKLGSEYGPEFDGYTNQTYGTSRVGTEINGEAYDSMATAAEALWSKAAIDDQVGIGASYQTDEQVAETMRYAEKIEREKLALKPFAERLFAIKDPGSLVGKLAMLTPTNKSDGIKSTLALLKPSNLSSAVASRMVSPTFALNTNKVNPLHGVRTGYDLKDPSNRMSGNQLWEQYGCDSGGPTQETAQPEGVPFILPSTTNPCQRERTLSVVTTCYLDAADSCSFQDASTGVPGSITDDSSATPCYEGSEDLGVRDDAYTEGRQIRIRLCAINGMNSSSEESQPGGIPNANGRALASSISSEAWVKLVKLAKDQGIPLSASSTFRTMEHQQRLCNQNAACRGGSHTAVAEPGHSNHQSGTAMDIAEATGNLSSGATCESPATVGTATYQFLEANARTFGIKHYAKESWHWGTNESC